jgi:hypothetical protein
MTAAVGCDGWSWVCVFRIGKSASDLRITSSFVARGTTLMVISALYSLSGQTLP